MSEKTSRIEQNYNALDFDELQKDLSLADVEEMDEREYSVAKYKATGERPVKVAKSDAKKFGLRHAFWDIYAPVEEGQKGQWQVESDAEGNEFIIRKESKLEK